MNRWLIYILFALIFFVCMWAVGVIHGQSLKCDPDFFFNGWEIKAVMTGKPPLAALIVVNPDPKGKPQKVKVLVNVAEKTIDGYAYWEDNKIRLFEGNENGKYLPTKTPQGCYQCHPKPTPT